MARPLRILQSEFPYHITTRANNKRRRFKRKRQHLKVFSEILNLAVNKYNLVIEHLVIMGTHYHMIANTPNENLDRVMQLINSQLAKKYNKLLGRSGHLWGERYKATILGTELAYMNCVSYIYRNPGRAGLPVHEYLMANSTFSCYAFGKKVDVLVTPDSVYLSLAETPQERQARFIEMIASPMDQEEEKKIREALRKQAYGSAPFLERLKEEFGDRLRLRRTTPLEPSII
jgi:REP element-mobilizing transposase RayT